MSLLKVGIGNANPGSIGFMGRNYQVGASLKAWKDYLPDSKIFGADIDKSTLFKEERIFTCFVDQLSTLSLKELAGNFTKERPSLIIDDGLHTPLAAINTFTELWGILEPGGFYVIEDMSKIMEPFFASLGLIFANSQYQFFDLTEERFQINNCLAVYRKSL